MYIVYYSIYVTLKLWRLSSQSCFQFGGNLVFKIPDGIWVINFDEEIMFLPNSQFIVILLKCSIAQFALLKACVCFVFKCTLGLLRVKLREKFWNFMVHALFYVFLVLIARNKSSLDGPDMNGLIQTNDRTYKNWEFWKA